MNGAAPLSDLLTTVLGLAPRLLNPKELRSRDFVNVARLAVVIPVDAAVKMVKNVVMKDAPIAEVKKRLCELVDLVEAGETIVILRHGRPVARLTPMPVSDQPWRVEKPDDPNAYKGIDIDEPVLEDMG